VTDTTAPGIKADLQTVESLLQDAREYFESYRQASSEGDFGEAGNALDNLEETLERIENQTE